MPLSRAFVFALLPIFAGCVYTGKPDAPIPSSRMQGEVKMSAGKLLFQPCDEKRQFVISDDDPTGVAQDARRLLADGASSLHADFGGQLTAGDNNEADGRFVLDTVYRLQAEGQTCHDLNFLPTVINASGTEPDWNVLVSNKGMLLKRLDKDPLVLPYVVEQLPEGRTSIASEANGERVELWVTPQRCINSMSGGVQHLSAELRLNGTVMRGCAYYGGAYDR